jgi:predicted Rossmann fold flavoprotein
MNIERRTPDFSSAAEPGLPRLVVIGGGAAGLFCAVNAARLNPKIDAVVVEKTGKMLAKVKVSGGGRCNVTHACFSIPEMARKYPRGVHFVKRAFHQFFTTDTVEWFSQRGLGLKSEEDGRMFPVTDSSQSVIDCLLKEADTYGVRIILHTEAKEIRGTRPTGQPDQKRFRVFFSDTDYLDSDFVCVCCGGYPKMPMFDWLKQLGHSVEEPVPSLFTFNIPHDPITQLMGVSLTDVQVKIGGTKLVDRGPLLITHWGLSGPVVLRLSAWGARLLNELGYRFIARLNWVPHSSDQSVRKRLEDLRLAKGSQQINSKNPFGLPARLWVYLTSLSGVSSTTRWGDVPGDVLKKLVNNLSGQEFHVSGKTTYKEEFVTAGGVKLQEIDPHTMESKIWKGLFFAGEILDVDGITGGFNFQHAWTSGFIAAKAISESASKIFL